MCDMFRNPYFHSTHINQNTYPNVCPPPLPTCIKMQQQKNRMYKYTYTFSFMARPAELRRESILQGE